VQFLGHDLLVRKASDRARSGLFLAFQYPKEIAGVTLRSFLFAAYKAQMLARHPEEKSLSPLKFKKLLEEKMKGLTMDPSFAERSLNKGFSGGEKKKAEVLQLSVLQPTLALLDETDSGLDIDALKIVAEGVHALRSPKFSAIVVTHYARILDYLAPDKVHVMVKGKIVESGGIELALELERSGYAKYGVQENAASLSLPLESDEV
jgi:Fe-S cluster assembly ATP-binding protein